MNPLDFVKMHGIGNDFIVIDCMNQDFYVLEQAKEVSGLPSGSGKGASDTSKIISYLSKIAPKMCHRHFGIGSDGLILVFRADDENCDFQMRMLNPDGSEAEMCGNGIRVFAKYIYDYNLSREKTIKTETPAGIKIIDIYEENGKCEKVAVDMGEPGLSPGEIPFKGYADLEKVVSKPLTVLDREFLITCVNMGNPHCVTIVDNADKIDLEKYGPAIENHELFPERTNVEFIEIIDENNIKMRVWERGASETLACGTGACASGVAAMLNGKVNRKVNIHLAGGDLIIEWKENNHVIMTGPCTEVFRGTVPEDILCDWQK